MLFTADLRAFAERLEGKEEVDIKGEVEAEEETVEIKVGKAEMEIDTVKKEEEGGDGDEDVDAATETKVLLHEQVEVEVDVGGRRRSGRAKNVLKNGNAGNMTTVEATETRVKKRGRAR